MPISKKKFISFNRYISRYKISIFENEIRSLDAILYTHEHSDQTSGIFEMRPFFWKNKKKFIYMAVQELLRT